MVWLIGVLAVAGITVAAFAPPVAAGGSSWSFDSDHYEPGTRAIGRAVVSWAHNPELGAPEDGPYSVYLAPLRWSDPVEVIVPPDAMWVAEVQLSPEPLRVATIEFTVPDLPVGVYAVSHCNSPCTTRFGDITFGSITIGPEPIPLPPPPTTAAPRPATTTTLPPTPTTTTTTSPVSTDAGANASVAIPIGAVGGAVALIGGVAGGAYTVRRRR